MRPSFPPSLWKEKPNMFRVIFSIAIAIATYIAIGTVFYNIAPGVALHHVTPVLPVINASLSTMVLTALGGALLAFGITVKA